MQTLHTQQSRLLSSNVFMYGLFSFLNLFRCNQASQYLTRLMHSLRRHTAKFSRSRLVAFTPSSRMEISAGFPPDTLPLVST